MLKKCSTVVHVLKFYCKLQPLPACDDFHVDSLRLRPDPLLLPLHQQPLLRPVPQPRPGEEGEHRHLRLHRALQGGRLLQRGGRQRGLRGHGRRRVRPGAHQRRAVQRWPKELDLVSDLPGHPRCCNILICRPLPGVHTGALLTTTTTTCRPRRTGLLKPSRSFCLNSALVVILSQIFFTTFFLYSTIHRDMNLRV